MEVTGLDIAAFAAGVVAVVFSGFVLVHSTLGGAALLAGGVLAVSVTLIRDQTDSAVVGGLVWLLILGLFVAGVAGFLTGFGVFDEPDLRWEGQASTYEGADGPTVVVTGTVTNAGDVAAERVLVNATLRDADGDAIATDTKRLTALDAGSEQMVFFRFEGDDDLDRSTELDVELEAAG
jgi:hypothetical protein